jgi:hypothetical protein
MGETNMKIYSPAMKVLPGSSIPMNFNLQHNQNSLESSNFDKIPAPKDNIFPYKYP